MADTLLVRHLPDMTAAEVSSLLQHFGAQRVRYMGNTGRLKHCAFATYQTVALAADALRCLHQLNVCGHRLVVEFARQSDCKHFPRLCDRADAFTPDHGRALLAKALFVAAPEFDPGAPLPMCIALRYPAPDQRLVERICQTMLTNPTLFQRVLFVMECMRLPPPWDEQTIFIEPPVAASIVSSNAGIDEATVEAVANKADLIVQESSSESEMDESELGHNLPDPFFAQAKRSAPTDRSQPKLYKKQRTTASSNESVLRKNRPSISTCFDIPGCSGYKDRSIVIRTCSQESSCTKEVSATHSPLGVVSHGGTSGFADIETVPVVPAEHTRSNCITDEDMEQLAVFKNYVPGTPSRCLYVKNLAKKTSEIELRNLFANVVDAQSDTSASAAVEVRLMTHGRMKGQAFVTFMTVEKATAALHATNGYLLNGKPLVVCFARSQS